MVRLPRWAEKAFSLKCTEGDAIASPPDEDVNGWDYLVELPSRRFAGLAEDTPPTEIVFTQVKSTKGGKHSAQIKLSNVVKACRSHDPWFVVLVTADRHGRNTRFFGQHVWGRLLYDGLAAVRKAGLEGVALNSRRLTVKFTPEEAIDGDIVHWMRNHRDAAGNDYREAKREVLKTAGYEEGFGSGRLTIEAPSTEHISDAFLGLGNGIEVKRFVFTPERFGIASNAPEIDTRSGKLFIEPKPSGVCEIRIRGNSAEPSVALRGTVYSFLLPGRPREETRLRFSAPPLDVIWGINEPSRITLSLKPDQEYSADQLWSYVQISRWSRNGDLDFKISSDGKALIQAHAHLEDEEKTVEIEKLALIIDAIRRSIDGYGSMQITLRDIQADALELGYFAQVLAQGSLRLQYPPQDEDVPPNVSMLLYKTGASLGTWRMGCVVRRDVREDTIQDGRRTITSGPPVILESMIWERQSTDRESQLTTIFDQITEKEQKKSNALGLGDINALIEVQNND